MDCSCCHCVASRSSQAEMEVDVPPSRVTAANVTLRLARAALGMVYGKPVAWRAPDLVAAWGGDGCVELEFAHVESRMDTVDLQAVGFRIEDERGEVAVERVIYPQDQRLELVLGRDLEGAAVVHGGYGKAPATVPADMERMLPMLGFWGAAVG